MPVTQKISTAHDMYQPESALFHPELLKVYFDHLRLPVQKGALINACMQAQPDGNVLPPIQRITAILRLLKLHYVQAAFLRFARFDLRRLPALVFHHGQWQFLEKKDEGLLLSNSDGKTISCTEADLREAMVIWLNYSTNYEYQGGLERCNPARSLVLHELFRSRRWLFDVVIATLVINVMAVAISVFAMQVYDRVVPTLAYATLWTLVGGMIIILCLDWILKTIRARILDSVSCSVDKEVSQKVFDHILKLQLDQLPQSLGTLAAQVGGLDIVRQFFSSAVVFALVDMPFAIMFIAFIGIIGGSVGWVYTALLPVAAGLGLISQILLRRLLRLQMIRSNERQGLLVDTIRGAESIRSSNAGWRFSDEWKKITRTISRYNVRQKAVSNLTVVTTGSLSSLAYVLAVVVGVNEIADGNLTMGGLIACSILGGRVIAPIAQSIQYLSQWQNVSQALKMVNQVLVLNTERPSGQRQLIPDTPPEHIFLEEIGFSYRNSPVQQLNIPQLTFSAGERVAIIGPVGSGKSTLLKVLAGIYKPTRGRVRLGQADLWEIDPNIIAEQIGYLPQTVRLFKGTMRSNLTMSGSVNDDELLKTCRELGIDRIMADNPRGMDLEISEGGEGLSGGQRQLVGLARIFLARPRIWLLDEPSSSLDSESESQVFKALQDYVKDQDILIISTHRPMLIARMVNRIIAIQQGKIVADGSPETVIARIRAGQTNSPPAMDNSHKGAFNVI